MRLLIACCGLLCLAGCGEKVFYLGEAGAPSSRVSVAGPEPPLQLLWEQKLDGAPLGGALFAGTLALQLTTSPSLYAYDRHTGVKLGKKGFDEMACGPGILVGELFMLSQLGAEPGLLALDRRTLEERWFYPGVFCQAPVVAGDTLLLVDEKGTIGALRTADGEALWSVDLADRVRVGLAQSDGLLFAGTSKGDLVALSQVDGSEKWRQALDTALRSRPLPDGDKVYTATAAGRVVAVDAAAGEVIWQQSLGGLPTEDLALGAGILLVGSVDRHIYGLDASTGEVRWSFAAGGVVRSSPTITAQTAYCAASDGYLYALELESGRLLWKYKVDGQVLAPVVIAEGLLGVVSEKRTLYVFGRR